MVSECLVNCALALNISFILLLVFAFVFYIVSEVKDDEKVKRIKDLESKVSSLEFRNSSLRDYNSALSSSLAKVSSENLCLQDELDKYKKKVAKTKKCIKK